MMVVSTSGSDEKDLQPVPRKPAIWIFLLGILLGVFAGFGEVKVGDLLLTALLVLAFTMLLGTLRPERPWRWALLVAVCIPLSRLFAAKVSHEFTERAQIYESFLAFLPAIVGAYSGAVLRNVVKKVFDQQSENAEQRGPK
jgi:hypothetical protein